MSAFANVLVGLDMDETAAGAVLARACELADPQDIEAVHACLPVRYEGDFSAGTLGGFETGPVLDAVVHRQADDYLTRVCAQRGIDRHRVLDGAAADALHDYAREHADLLVIGSHGRGLARSLFASTSNAVLHGTPCDVLAVHLGADGTADPAAKCYRKVLAAVDLSDESFQVMDAANRVALRCEAELAICTVARDMDEEDAVYMAAAQDHLEHLADAYGVAEDDVFEVAGNVAHRIRQLAADIGAGLVVVGTHGKHGLQLLSGSTANAVLHGSACDVLAARVY